MIVTERWKKTPSDLPDASVMLIPSLTLNYVSKLEISFDEIRMEGRTNMTDSEVNGNRSKAQDLQRNISFFSWHDRNYGCRNSQVFDHELCSVMVPLELKLPRMSVMSTRLT